MTTYAKANRTAQWFSNAYSSAAIAPNCVVWHSTETFGWPGYSGGSMAPNYTALPDIANQRVEWHAHFEDEESSRALVNAPGGVETNTANDVQVEIVGTCNPAWARAWPGTSKVAGRDYLYLPDAPDWFLAGLADFARDMNRRHGVPLTSGVTWAAYPGSYGTGASQRMSFAQWRSFTGHCGHQHVPENDHGDPGALPVGRILELAKVGTVAPTPQPAPAPAPAKPTVKVANVRPGAVNEDVRRFNALMWAWVGPTFRARWNTRWQSEPANKFGPVSQQVLQAIYLALSKKEPANFQPVALPTWPGTKVVARIGGTPI